MTDSLRLEWARAAVFALEHCPRDHAEAICAAWLDQQAAGMPVHTAFGDLRADAEFWADCATNAELQVYFASALKRLEKSYPGIAARKRLFWSIWISLPVSAQAAFLARVSSTSAHQEAAA